MQEKAEGAMMTEQQWLTSTDPAAMVAHLGERITDEQRRFFVEACRLFWPIGTQWANRLETATELDRAFYDCCRSSPPYPSDPSPLLRADILRDIVGNPFKPMRLEIGTQAKDLLLAVDGLLWPLGDWLTWQDGAIPLMVDAMLNEDCGECDGAGWFKVPRYDCKHCNGKGRIPRAEPRWADMLVIADALESAGCSEPAILEHLRSERDGERCPWCAGKGWFNLPLFKPAKEGENPMMVNGQVVTSCSHCHATGRIRRRHWRGCWVVELLRGKP